MSEYCVVVAGGSNTRIFTLEPAEVPELQSGPNLIEQHSLRNPQHGVRDAEFLAEPRVGRNRAAFGPGHGFDDHRDQHEKGVDRRFARDVAGEISRIAERTGFQHVVLCGDTRMLGTLRSSLNGSLHHARVHEVAKDLTKLSGREIHDRLAQDGHLPVRRRRARA